MPFSSFCLWKFSGKVMKSTDRKLYFVKLSSSGERLEVDRKTSKHESTNEHEGKSFLFLSKPKQNFFKLNIFRSTETKSSAKEKKKKTIWLLLLRKTITELLTRIFFWRKTKKSERAKIQNENFFRCSFIDCFAICVLTFNVIELKVATHIQTHRHTKLTA